MDGDCQNQVLREILLENIQTDIMMVREGLIPSSEQQQRLADLKDAVEEGLISNREYKKLSAQWLAAVNSIEQLTDEAFAQRCVAESGGKILYLWQGAGDSVVMIGRERGGFYSVAYLDAAALGKDMAMYALRCMQALQCFAASQGVEVIPITERQRQEWCPPQLIPTLQEALSYAVAELSEML